MESSKRTARLAGLAYLVVGVASGAGYLCAPLMQPDPAGLARFMAASELRFRVAIASDLIAQVSGIVLVVLLYQLFKQVHKTYAALMAILLLVSAPISFVLTLNGVAARILLSGAMTAFTKPQLDTLANLFLRLHIHGVFAVEIYWGLWLLPFGILVFRSGFLPRILGIFLVIAGFAYVAHSFVSLFFPGVRSTVYEVATMAARGLGELPIMFWLLVKGVEIREGEKLGA